MIVRVQAQGRTWGFDDNPRWLSESQLPHGDGQCEEGSVVLGIGNGTDPNDRSVAAPDLDLAAVTPRGHLPDFYVFDDFSLYALKCLTLFCGHLPPPYTLSTLWVPEMIPRG